MASKTTDGILLVLIDLNRIESYKFSLLSIPFQFQKCTTEKLEYCRGLANKGIQ
tara:strand:+ start:26859 stop:27020 length:162 start_codon:yes stop_codon:yes gene_type:complete